MAIKYNSISELKINDIVSTDQLSNIYDIHILLANPVVVDTASGEGAIQGKIVYIDGISNDNEYKDIYNAYTTPDNVCPAVFFQSSTPIYERLLNEKVY